MNLILVIEDGNNIHAHLQQISELSNFSVVTAKNSIIGLKLAKSKYPHLIICDIMTPELNVNEILTELRCDSKTVDIPLIFINAKADCNLRQAIGLGSEDYYTNRHLKPFKIIPAIISSLPINLRNTEQKQSNQEIGQVSDQEKEMNEFKSRFVSLASHEFRTPLAIISSSAGILKDFGHKLSEEKKKKHLDCIDTYIKHTTKLLDNILLINQAEHGKLAVEPAPVDLISFCQQLVEEIQLSAPNHTIVFSSNPQSGVTGNVDQKLLRQILINLLTNAIKYSPNSATVNFNMNITHTNVTFSIQDQGIGIPQPDQGKLFELFHRASNVGNIPGIGLGLSIVAKCIELHQGSITVNSELGKGTTFDVTIPLQLVALLPEVVKNTSE